MTVICVPIICQNDVLSQNVLKPMEVKNDNKVNKNNALSQNVLKLMEAKNENKIKPVGVDSVGPSHTTGSHDLRVAPVAHKFVVPPWTLSNIEPDVNLHPISNNSKINVESILNMEQYVPQECNNNLFEVMPELISDKNRHLINIRRPIGTSTLGKAKNDDLRADLLADGFVIMDGRLIDIKKPIGICSIGVSKKTPNHNLKSLPSVPKFVASPWSNTNVSLKPLF